MSKLPIMYEVDMFFAHEENTRLGKRKIVAKDFDAESNRSEQIDARVMAAYPSVTEYSVRLMRRDEIKAITHRPLDERLIRWLIDSALNQALALSELEKTNEQISVAA